MKERIVIWGSGVFLNDHIEDILNRFEIVAIVDSFIEGEKRGFTIQKPTVIKEHVFDKVLVMVKNEKDCFDIIHDLNEEYGVEYNRIIIGKSLYGNGSIEWGDIDDKGKVLLIIGQYRLRIGSFNEFYNVEDVLCKDAYNYNINNDKLDIVIDVGMNIGDSALYFLNREKTKRVYAYEPFFESYEMAKQNLSDYLHSDRLRINHYGLSDRDETRQICFNRDMPCAQSTIASVREEVLDDFVRRGIAKQINDKSEIIEVRDAATIIREIIQKEKDSSNIVLKVDCEGEEYYIFRRLYEEKVLEYIDFIMLEWHYQGKEDIIKYVTLSGLSYYHIYKTEKMGLLYAFKSK